MMAPKARRRTALELEPASRAEWRRWLGNNNDSSNGIWVIIYKKASGKRNLSTEDVVEEALCFGWIDSVPNKIDDSKFKLWVSPRRPTSGWSALNKKRIKQLIASNQMTDAGLDKINLAKKNGSWRKLDSASRLEIPKALMSGLSKNSKAKLFFDKIAPSSKKAILEWINAAKTQPTRERRIRETIRLACKGIRANNYQDLQKSKNPAFSKKRLRNR
jgi:uncharacterized protein YdeI (YjbR/CyaY-like superfamily)